MTTVIGLDVERQWMSFSRSGDCLISCNKWITPATGSKKNDKPIPKPGMWRAVSRRMGEPGPTSLGPIGSEMGFASRPAVSRRVVRRCLSFARSGAFFEVRGLAAAGALHAGAAAGRHDSGRCSGSGAYRATLCELLCEVRCQDQEAAEQYDWAMLEMYDQTVREGTGGEMLAYIQTANESQLSFAKERLGTELERMRHEKSAGATRARERNKRGASLAETLRRKAFRLIAGREGIFAYDQGMFRRSGELHKWMYDRYSLGKALKAAGFTDAKQCGAAESRIAEWASFHLDTEPDGRTYKPDSLFMEATRP